MAICIYAPNTDDFSSNGLGILTPEECLIKETAGGMYELTLVHPIDLHLRWAQIQNGCYIKAPAPVRENPLYEESAGSGSESIVVREIYRVVKTSVGVRLRTGPGTGYKRLSTHKNGTLVVKLDQPSPDWMHVCMVKGGAVGYMSTKYLALDHTENETVMLDKPGKGRVIQLEQSREQIFRINSVETDTEAQTVTATAMQAFYDLRGNLIDGDYSPENADAAEVVRQISSKLSNAHPFTFHAERLAGLRVSGEYGYINPVEALLDPEQGIAAQTKAWVLRDNFDIHLLPDSVRDMGVTIRRGKNLIGVTVTTDATGIVTRIIPVGKDKNGKPLYLDGTKHVDSPHINDYPIVYSKRIEYDVSVGEKFKNNAAVRAEIRRLAEEEYSVNGIDMPTYGMEVNFVLLQNTAEYANYASLQAVHLYDTVTVIDELIGLKAKLQVTEYTWNALTKQYDSVILGRLHSVEQMVYSYNLPEHGISGSKLIQNTVDGAALRNLTVDYGKFNNATIQQLAADSITAVTAKIQEIVSGKLTTEELYAALAEIFALKVSTLTANDITTDSLAAALAAFTVITAGTASFDRATVAHLVAQALNLEFGTLDQVFIRNLAVEYAQMVGATISNLCIKASDGNYYLMDVKPDGTVTATRTTVTDAEISAGQLDGGQVILETSITAANLNAGNLLATYALVNRIDAARIDVDTLFAREAFIALLRTSKIVGDKSITLIAQEAAQANRNFYQSEAPTGRDLVRPGDTWTIPETGEVYQAQDAGELGLKFYLDADGSLYYELAIEREGVSLSVQGFDLYGEGLYFSVLEDGTMGTPYIWQRVQDQELVAAIQGARIHDGTQPPAAPIETGKLWLDRSVTPMVLRRWLGLDVSPADMSGWEIVNDTAIISAALDQVRATAEAAVSRDELNHYVQARTDGLYVGLLNQKSGYTRITYNSFDVISAEGGVTASLGDARQDLGSLTIYTTAEGHTAFVPREV